jgi:hypothetical protein
MASQWIRTNILACCDGALRYHQCADVNDNQFQCLEKKINRFLRPNKQSLPLLGASAPEEVHGMDIRVQVHAGRYTMHVTKGSQDDAQHLCLWTRSRNKPSAMTAACCWTTCILWLQSFPTLPTLTSSQQSLH